jgi:mannitol operon repressor
MALPITMIKITMADPINEADIIERLNTAPSVRGFFIAAVDIFEDAIDNLVQRIFRSDYLAVKAVINPLLGSSGPLGNLSVRIKLLFGLGVVADNVYHDIEGIIELRDKLNNDGTEYSFTNPKILTPIKKLHSIKQMGSLQFEAIEPDDDVDIEFYQLQLARQQQIIKSSLSLMIVDTCNKLNIDSPFTM